jgi:hypothetical protein
MQSNNKLNTFLYSECILKGDTVFPKNVQKSMSWSNENGTPNWTTMF